jgi:hypothetical protein
MPVLTDRRDDGNLERGLAGPGEHERDGDRLSGAQRMAQAGQQYPVGMRAASVISACAVAEPAGGAGMRALMMSTSPPTWSVVPGLSVRSRRSAAPLALGWRRAAASRRR